MDLLVQSFLVFHLFLGVLGIQGLLLDLSIHQLHSFPSYLEDLALQYFPFHPLLHLDMEYQDLQQYL